tara:strand:+ start:14169 stop:15521 length:1353 start_codon:yes stop_codon:yes gene_type:complete
MFKKIEIWILYIILVLFFLILILYGSLLVHHFRSGTKFPQLRKIAVFLAETPSNFKQMLEKKTLNIDKLKSLPKHQGKKQLSLVNFKEKDAILILPRYDGDLSRSVVEIIDLKDFKIIHKFSHDINFMLDKINTDRIEFKNLKRDNSLSRFIYQHPIIDLEDGGLVSIGSRILFKIDICSNLIWLNQDEVFHHSISYDSNKSGFWVGGRMFPTSDLYKKHYGTNNFDYKDDAIIKVDNKGNIIFRKSIAEILGQNNIIGQNLFYDNSVDPIHLNDIEVAKTKSEFWDKGDLFISVRHLESIIHYRPSTDLVINYITGPFFQQHDVDIISDHEITIFNNNNTFLDNAKYSEVLIYDFIGNKFKTRFDNELVKLNFKTITGGLSETTNDNSILLDEQNHGRLLFFDKNNFLQWEYVNTDKKGNVYYTSWPRIIDDKTNVEKIRYFYKNKACN